MVRYSRVGRQSDTDVFLQRTSDVTEACLSYEQVERVQLP